MTSPTKAIWRIPAILLYEQTWWEILPREIALHRNGLIPVDCHPPPYTFGNLERNYLRSDWYRDLDCSIFRRFPFGDRLQLEFRAEAFNATNSVVFAAPANVINGAEFGVVTSTANTPRQLQVALKFVF